MAVDVSRNDSSFASFSGFTDGNGELSKTYTNAPGGVYSCEVVDLDGNDPSEPANDHDKGVDPVPDSDCS